MATFVSTYNPEIALGICERVAEGETLKAILSDTSSGLPTRSTFNRWVVKYPELTRAYAAARELSAHSLEEEALDAARELKDEKGRKKLSSTEIRALEVAMNQLRWSAARRNPKVYSERGAITVTVPIQINTSLDLGDGATADIYSLKANVVTPQEAEETEYQAQMQADTQPLLTKSEQAKSLRYARLQELGPLAKRPRKEEAEDAQVRGSDLAGRE